MDLFYDAFVTYLDFQNFGYLDFQWRDRKCSGFIKNILICVLKMNQNLMGLKWHEGEKIMTEFSFLGELSL